MEMCGFIGILFCFELALHTLIECSSLADWIWKPLIERAFDEYVDEHNDHRVRKQIDKPGPSGTSMNFAHAFPEQFNGTDCLIAVDKELISDLLEVHPAHEQLKFWPDWFGQIASRAYRDIGSPEIKFENAWDLWGQMFPQVLHDYRTRPV